MTPNRSADGAAPRDPAHRGRTPREQIRFFTIAEVAEIVRVSTRTVRRWIKSRKLAAHSFPMLRIAESDLEAFLAQHRHP